MANEKMKGSKVRRLVIAGMLVALGVLIPQIFHAVPGFGKIYLPMHIPVILCGMICGPWYGIAAGIITPLLSSLIFGMPVMYPMCVTMMLELATYGVVSGLLSAAPSLYDIEHGGTPRHTKRLSAKIFASPRLNIFVSLIAAMLAGRAVSGIANYILLVGIGGGEYTWKMFLAGAFVMAWPGIVIQFIVIPAVMLSTRHLWMFKEKPER